MPASFGVHVCESFIGLSASDNSAAAGARTCRKYGPGRSFGLLGSLWDDSWVHPEGYLERNRRAKRSLINELLLSYTPTIRATFILKHFCARRNPFLRFSVSTVPELYQNPCKRGLFAPRQHSIRWHGGSAACVTSPSLCTTVTVRSRSAADWKRLDRVAMTIGLRSC